MSTILCPTCGTRLSETATRCLVCGTELTKRIALPEMSFSKTITHIKLVGKRGVFTVKVVSGDTVVVRGNIGSLDISMSHGTGLLRIETTSEDCFEIEIPASTEYVLI